MSDLLQRYQSFVHENKLFTKDHNLLIAVSGGLDSSVLVHLTVASGYHAELAHCNFQLRENESERDEEFVRSLASDYNLGFHLKKFNTRSFAEQNHVSIQEAARELRYSWFKEILEHNHFHRVLTAHHADDNVETMVMNLFKGTGMLGLRGILPLTGNIARPLLFSSRKELEEYASKHGIGHVEDSSNNSDKYSRNFFRLNIIPIIEQIYPGTQQNLRNNMPRFREAEQLYRQSVEKKLEKLKKHVGDEVHIPVELLKLTTPLSTIIYELFNPYGFSSGQVPEISKLMESETGKYIESSSYRLLKNRNWFILSPLNTTTPSIFTIDQAAREVIFPAGKLNLDMLESTKTVDPDPNIACIDARYINYPLVLRKWKAGDYFYPLGMQKKKKLARFFIDTKLSRTDKEKIWVIESSGKIIWVVGHRLDNRVKLTETSSHLVRISFQPAV